MKLTALIIITILTLSEILGQNYTISGYVIDAGTGEKLLGAIVFELNSKTGTVTNNYGFYSITVKSNDTINLTCNFLGYEKYSEKISLTQNIEKNISLKTSENLINEITITGGENRNQLSVVSLSPKQISLIPTLGGEKDIFKALQLMPGVMQGSEGKSGLYVRGGSPDQNLIMLDDVPLYYAEHLGGFLSVFNDDALTNIKLMKGSIPAKYGGRLSSVLDIRMKDGSMSKYTLSGSLGLISSKIAIDGPIIKDKVSFMFSARRMMLDILILPFVRMLENNSLMGYSFYDVNAKINFKLNNKNNLYLSFYNGNDNVNINDKIHNHLQYYDNISKQKWGNYMAAFRWNHVYGNKLFSNFTLSISKFQYSTFNETLIKYDTLVTSNSNNFYSGISDINSKLDYEFYINNRITFNYGVACIYHIFKPAEIKYFQQEESIVKTDTTISNSQLKSVETSAYLEGNIKITSFLSTVVGVRTNYYYFKNSDFYSVEPRCMLDLKTGKKSSIKLSYTYIEQNVHLLSFSGMGVYSDLWVPSTENVIPEKSWQTAFGFEKNMYEGKYNIQIEAYYKKLYNLLSFGYGTFWNNAANWEANSEKKGVGTCYGIEFFFNKKVGKLTGWFGYSYSKSTRQFENINSGKVYDYDYDRPHEIKITGNYQIKNNLNFSATWIFQSGRPINIPIGTMPFIDESQMLSQNLLSVDYNYPFNFFYDKNSIRMSPYHRLDVALNCTKEKKHGTRVWSFSIYNVYNRQNAYYYFFSFEYSSNGTPTRKLYQRSLFPIIPSISYSFKF